MPQADQTDPGYTPDPGYDGAVIADADPGDPPPDGGMTGNGPDQPNNSDNSARQVAYVLDGAGNRTYVSDSTIGTTPYTPNILNEYSNVGTDTVGNGNEHEITDYQGAHYVYLFDTHLIGVSLPGGNAYQLAYDALGRCVTRTLTLNNVTANPTYYIYDGEKPIQEFGPASASNIYGLGIDEPVIRFTSGPNYFFYQDHEGSVTHVIGSDVSGLTEQYRYDVFGAPTIMDRYRNVRSQSAIGNRFMFTGREYAATFGFYEYRARAYHPGIGRFMSEDPKDFDGGDYNLFRYCHNDPEDHTDPMGLDSVNLYEPGSNDSQAANLRGVKSNEITVGGHADGKTGVFVDARNGKPAPMTEKQLANAIKEAADYDAKKTVRLYQCKAGQGDDSRAQKLSTHLPNPVTASTTDTKEVMSRDRSTGKIVESTEPKPVDGGKWITFQNGKQRKDVESIPRTRQPSSSQ